MIKAFCSTLFFFFFLVSVSAQKWSPLPPGLDAYIARVMQAFQVPGMAVSIVQDGKVLLAKGYGVKQFGNTERVDPHTLFLIASNTKAFTATALGMLVEDGKLKWDDPVVKYLPWFQLSDPYITRHLTVRDLLIHHSGLPAFAGDFMLFEPSCLTRREVLEKLPLIPMRYEFRSTYAYDNILYAAAGELVEAVSGKSWEDFIKARIFEPVGMSESISRFSDLKSRDNRATAHSRYEGKVQVIDNFMDRAIGNSGDPAGGIVSNAMDMARWLITQLDSGRTPSNQTIFHPATTTELWKMIRPIPLTIVQAPIKPAQMGFYGYCSGFRTYNYNKYRIVGHTGSLKGFVSQVTLVPELKLGISILTNQQSTLAYWALSYQILDYFTQQKPFDWIGGYKVIDDSSMAQTRRRHNSWSLKKDTAGYKPLPLERYTGTFSDALMGNVSIAREGEGLVLRFANTPTYIADLEYFQYNTFIAHFRNMEYNADAMASFSIGPDGKIPGVLVKQYNPKSILEFDNLHLKPTL